VIDAFVVTPAKVRAAWPFIPVIGRPGAVYVGPTGETVILRADGGADPVHPFGHKSIASEPLATRRAP
jgi:hypothetical protein